MHLSVAISNGNNDSVIHSGDTARVHCVKVINVIVVYVCMYVKR